MDVGKLAVRLLVTSADGEDSLPVVRVAKFSLNTIGTTTKSVTLVPVPNELVTEILPLVAVPGTVAVIWVALSTVKVAETALNFTALAPAKLLPVNTTKLPGAPLAGLKEVMDEIAVSGGKITIWRLAVPVPSELVAEMETLNVPATVGVPEINPVMVLTVNPVGKPVAANEMGVWVATIW